MAMQPYTTEEIKTFLEINRFMKQALIERIAAIEALLAYGEKLKFEVVRMIVGEETFKKWLAEPGAAQAAIQEAKDEIKKIEEEISSLEALL